MKSKYHEAENILEYEIEKYSDIPKLVKNLRKFADKHTICLTIKDSFQEFQTEFGRVLFRNPSLRKSLSKTPFALTEQFYFLFGGVMLDEMMPKTFFVKSEKECKVYEVKKKSEDQN